jgi:hypothetical protein
VSGVAARRGAARGGAARGGDHGPEVHRPRSWRPAVLGLAAVLILIVATAVLILKRSGPSPSAPRCVAIGPLGSYALDLAQASNATTIAAVGKRGGLPDHAVTIALAAALQESQLRNLTYGDLDSVGLFQQRPSQGWGSRSQLLTPRYAASAFYDGLRKVPGWATLPVTAAAQRVQRSAAPDAYAQWENEARTLAEVLTGEVQAGLTCRFAVPATVTASSSLGAAMTDELGTSALGAELAPARGWTVANWLIGHAPSFRITSVSFAGQRWTPTSGKWQPHPPASALVELGRAGV